MSPYVPTSFVEGPEALVGGEQVFGLDPVSGLWMAGDGVLMVGPAEGVAEWLSGLAARVVPASLTFPHQKMFEGHVRRVVGVAACGVLVLELDTSEWAAVAPEVSPHIRWPDWRLTRGDRPIPKPSGGRIASAGPSGRQ